jgi:hypothetical protein
MVSLPHGWLLSATAEMRSSRRRSRVRRLILESAADTHGCLLTMGAGDNETTDVPETEISGE